MKTLWKALAGLVALMVIVVGAGFGWASWTTGRKLSRTIETHRVDFPVPYPLSRAEAEGIEPAEAARIALERAVERGEHLVRARYACVECHGQDFSGGVMVDDPALGRLLGPNITSGMGSVVVAYRPEDWDRIVRHGVRPDGTPAAMPSEDFQRMTDQELSDIVAYILSQPPVDATVPRVRFGPLGKVLVATGQLPFSADLIGSHDEPHRVAPPVATVSAEFGEHLAGVCTGCHGVDLTGGPIAAGDPSWPPAMNLTPHADGLAGWTYADFTAAMLRAKRPDGTDLREPMTFLQPYAANMTETELQALWAYLQSLPPMTTGTD